MSDPGLPKDDGEDLSRATLDESSELSSELLEKLGGGWSDGGCAEDGGVRDRES